MLRKLENYSNLILSELPQLARILDPLFQSDTLDDGHGQHINVNTAAMTEGADERVWLNHSTPREASNSNEESSLPSMVLETGLENMGECITKLSDLSEQK